MPLDENERPIAVRVTENSFYALCRAFKQSAKFKGYSEATQALWVASSTLPAARIASVRCHST